MNPNVRGGGRRRNCNKPKGPSSKYAAFSQSLRSPEDFNESDCSPVFGCVAPPCDPTGGTAATVDSTTATVTWTDSSNTETHFLIEYRVKVTVGEWQQVTVPTDDQAGSGGEQSHDIEGLEYETEYEFRGWV